MGTQLIQSVEQLKVELSKLKDDGFGEVAIKNYNDAVDRAKDYCIEVFRKCAGEFPGQFTSHGPEHAGQVLKFAMIIAKRIEYPKIRPDELFLLGIASILHDIGMIAPLMKEITETIKDEDQRWEKRRKYHGEATAKTLRECKTAELNFIKEVDKELFLYLQKICAAHCTEGFSENIDKIKKLNDQYHSKSDLRFDLIAGILLFADELDLNYKRATDIERYDELKSNLSKAHWWKHWLVTDVAIRQNIIHISCVDKDTIEWADEFASWTKAKLERQIKMLKKQLGTKFWDFAINIDPTQGINEKDKLPLLTSNVIEEAQQSRLKINGQKLTRIVNPKKLIEYAQNKNSSVGPSDFFRKVVTPRIDILRGQGQHIEPAKAAEVYVESEKNMNLLDHVVLEWKNYAKDRYPSGIKVKLFCGEIGVGKTHFVSKFLNEISIRETELYNKTIIARAEYTEYDPKNNILTLKQRLAISLFDDLNKRLNILEKIRSIIEKYVTDINKAIPKDAVQIYYWNEDEIDRFIEVIGSICSKESEIYRELGDNAPEALFLICDNSDHIILELVNELYGWCYNTSGRANCLVWLFFRPDTRHYLESNYKNSHYSLRPSETIYPPKIEDVINKRLDVFPKRFKKDETIIIKNIKYTPEDSQQSLKYLVGLTIDTSDAMLPKLSNKNADSESSNIRAVLEVLISILGSRVLTDEEYIWAISTYNIALSEKTVFEKWYKILEAFIVGRRIWYSPNCGAVENLFSPPDVEENGDYFSVIHCLQVILKNNENNIYDYGTIIRKIESMGYSRGRIQVILKHLANRIEITQDSELEELTVRVFPLVKIEDLEKPFENKTSLYITPWGEYHLTSLFKQMQYWKHMFYQTTLPKSLVDKLNIQHVNGHISDLYDSLMTVIEYLSAIERSWLSGLSEYKLNELGIYSIMDKVSVEITRQYNKILYS